MESNCNPSGMITHVLIPKSDSKFFVVYHRNNSKYLKKLIRQYRRSQKQKPLLCHMLINLRTWGSPVHVNRHLCPVLTNKSKHREYWIKEQVLVAFGGACFKQNFNTCAYGNKTVFKDGKFVSEFEHGELPF